MKRISSEYADEPILDDLLTRSAARDQELAKLRRQVYDQEQAYRQAQERLNDYSRDWLYTTVCNFRGRIAWLKRCKDGLGSLAKTLWIVTRLILGMALFPLYPFIRRLGLMRNYAVEREPGECQLHVGFNGKLPDPLIIGKGASFVVDGWVFHPRLRIAGMELRFILAQPEPKLGEVVDPNESLDDREVEFIDRPVPVIIRNIPDRKIFSANFPKVDPKGNSYWSGFYAAITVPEIKRAGRAQLVVKAHMEDGAIETAILGKVNVLPEAAREDFDVTIPQGGTGPLVAICMTTYNPPAELFRRQIDSIRAQTHTNWFVLIRDDGSKPEQFAAIQHAIAGDSRFHLHRNEKNLGFYDNFAAVMGDVPPEAEFVALSDQDDIWHSDKLEVLLHEFKPETSLVYSDMRIVSESGHVRSETYWTSRDSNHENFTNLLLANTVTGAASMFRRKLLDYLLPLPDKVGDAYHDHWLGVTAMTLGKIGYVDRPLYDYVQHSQNVVGHVAPKPGSWAGAIYRFAAFFYPPRIVRNVSTYFRHGYGYYTYDLLRIQHAIRNALLRFGPETDPKKIQELIRMIHALETWRGLAWLAIRPFRRNAWRQTVGVEAHLFQARCWRAWHRLRGWFGPRITAYGGLRGTLLKRLVQVPTVYDHIDTVAAIERITAPLTLSIHEDSPRRVNLIVSIIDFRYVFGGYITVFHLARCLAQRGFQVRLIVVDECDFRPVFWAKNFQNYPGLEDFLDRVELVYAFDRRTVVHVSPHDVFMPTSWWTAHIAHKATQTLGKNRFVYLVQEYEPGFYPYGALASISAQSYSFPHYALFSTELLREFFRLHGHGVFSTREGEQNSASFQNTITSVGTVTPQDLSQKRRKRLLFYCRPEQHALRNMFDIGLMALRKAIAEGMFADWEFHGIGSLVGEGQIKLGPNAHMSLLPRLDQESYRAILKNYDIGLSLMCSPHPSLVPLEMCSAGMLTVTNTYANKTADKLLAISENFVPVDGTVEGVQEGLRTALANLNHVTRRVRGAKVNWATQWEQSFHPSLMDRLDQFIQAAMDDCEPEKEIIRRAA